MDGNNQTCTTEQKDLLFVLNGQAMSSVDTKKVTNDLAHAYIRVNLSQPVDYRNRLKLRFACEEGHNPEIDFPVHVVS